MVQKLFFCWTAAVISITHLAAASHHQGGGSSSSEAPLDENNVERSQDDAKYFENLVDHFSGSTATYSQRYYVDDTFFEKDGPILCILGGEGAATGIFYPWVVDTVAKALGGLVVEPEHRFYGASVPENATRRDALSPQQALADAARFVDFVRAEYNTSGYTAAIGGSYPGFLAAMARLRYPNVFRAAYAASAPMQFYSQRVDSQFAYYEIVTRSAEMAKEGCADVVRDALFSMMDAAFGDDLDGVTNATGVCPDSLPSYVSTADVLKQELAMVLMYTFANLNMANYPPGNTTTLYQACDKAVNLSKNNNNNDDDDNGSSSLRSGDGSSLDTVKMLLLDYAQPAGGACFNLSAQLPAGPKATVSSGDWSGVGTGQDGESWDFQTCTFLVEFIGTNGVTDCFPPRNFTLDWLERHCADRFSVEPQPTALVDLWGFDAANLPGLTSNIYFTNGLNDGWSAGGITTNLSDTIIAFNIEGGAHHSDLSHSPPSDADTEPVKEARALGLSLLQAWLST